MKIIEVSKDNFEKEVLKSEKKVLVDFYADWCGPCKMIRPLIEELAEKSDAAKVVSVNIEDEEELAEQYDVSSIPCLVLFEKGEEAKRNIGLMSKNDIEKMLGE